MNSIASKLLFQLTKIDQDLILKSMGEYGLSLKTLSSLLDLDHPELHSIFKEFYSHDDKFLDTCIELLDLLHYSKNHGYINTHPYFEEKLNGFFKGKLLNKSLNIRLLKENKDRNELRSLKESKKIDLYFLYSCKDFWLNFPESFDEFSRHDMSFKKDIEDALRRRSRYEEMGCLSLAEEIDADIKHIEQFNEMYYGFHQIKATTASVVLAKLLSLMFLDNGIFLNKDIPFSPVVVPVDDLNSSIELREIITNLDSLPDAGFKPIFDCFAVISPGINGESVKCVLVGEKEGKFYFISLVEHLFYN
jgi:hypothetical protein